MPESDMLLKTLVHTDDVFNIVAYFKNFRPDWSFMNVCAQWVPATSYKSMLVQDHMVMYVVQWI
jgi:hypothetical protein